MTNTAPALAISEGLSALLLWILENNDVDLAKEVIAKPWAFEDLAAIYSADPDRDIADAFEILEAQQRDD